MIEQLVGRITEDMRFIRSGLVSTTPPRKRKREHMSNSAMC